IVARRYGLYGYLHGSVSRPAEEEELEAWVQKDLSAQLLLVSAVDENLLADIHASLPSDLEESTAALTYSAILQTFRPNIVTHAIAIHRHLANRRLQPGEKMLTLWADITSKVRQLCAMEERTYGVGELMKWMGSALGEDYDGRMGTAAAMHRQKALTVEDFRMLLLEREQEMESRDEKPEDGKVFSMTQNSPWSRKSRSTPKPFPGTCYICGERGHKSYDCPREGSRRGGDGERKSGGGGNGDGGGNGKVGGGSRSGKGKDKESAFANVMDTHVFCLPEVDSGTNGTHLRRSCSELLWDSGAARCMSWDVNDFLDIRPVADRHVMNLAGKPLKVMGVGTLLVTTVNEVGLPTSTLELTNSWYVPDLNVKVIAHCLFAAKGCAIRGEGHDLEIWKGNSKVCGIERLEENGLYRIRGYPTHLGGSAKASSRIAGVSDRWALADGLREGGNLGENVDRVSQSRIHGINSSEHSMETEVKAMGSLADDSSLVDGRGMESGQEKSDVEKVFGSNTMDTSRVDSTHLEKSIRQFHSSNDIVEKSCPVFVSDVTMVSVGHFMSTIDFDGDLLDPWKGVEAVVYSNVDVPVWGSESMDNMGDGVPELDVDDSQLPVLDTSGDLQFGRWFSMRSNFDFDAIRSFDGGFRSIEFDLGNVKVSPHDTEVPSMETELETSGLFGQSRKKGKPTTRWKIGAAERWTCASGVDHVK
ncbi:hypothetical protein HDU93_003376, partial [Gonapodya sp. JEL0774]